MEILRFISMHRYFVILISILNFILVSFILRKMQVYVNRHIYEALGGRGDRSAIYGKCISAFKDILDRYEKKSRKNGLYIKMSDKIKKSGYSDEKAPIIYFTLLIIFLPALFAVSFIINFPDITKALALTSTVCVIIELFISGKRKEHNKRFQKHVYKIYKYLHNQISSGVRTTDAIKTVYEVIEDKRLRKIFIRLAATYELTLDIDKALNEFKSNYDTPEAETLCVALKQGVVTGDNRDILARQEDIMFKKYFYYIQAETDNCRFKSSVAVAMFCAIIVIMISIPLIKDVLDAVGGVFIS